MSNNVADQATITGTQSVVQSAVFGVWLKMMCEGFEDTKRVKIYADNEEDAQVQAILGQCHGYDPDEEDESEVISKKVREAVKNQEVFIDTVSMTDITIEYVVPLDTFDMKMVANGQERTFQTHYPIKNSNSDLPQYVINHYYQ